MNERTSRCLALLLIVVLGVGGVFLALASLALVLSPAEVMADSTATAKTLDRDLEPVIITGTAVSAFAGVPVDQLFVYAYTGGDWRQIPAQVDELTVTGAYTTTEDGLLDANDEIVFMAKDLGDQAQDGIPMANGRPISARWYEIEVTDPISPTQKGWAYLVHSSTLTPTFTSDYVEFDTTLHRINAASYSLGFGTTHPGFEYMALSGSGVDILDRTKTRLFCRIPIICPVTEDNLRPKPDDLVKDGPVRVIVRRGKGLAYGSMLSWTTGLEVPQLFAGDMYFSTDFSPEVSGATYYNAVVPEGVTVDGIADTVAAEPLSPWWQLSTDTDTLIQVADTSPISGTQSNYYIDNSEVDASDTGDQRHYGDTGVFIANPNLSFTYTFAIYFLTGFQSNLGERYAAYFSQPLSAAAQLQQLELPAKVYLPLIMKNAATSSTPPP